MGRHQTKILILACFIISAVSVYFILSARQKEKSFLSVPQNSSYSPPVANADSPEVSNIASPDGKAELVFKAEKGKENTTYRFSTINKSDGSMKEIFTKTVPVGVSISVPFNTFSPDNKYLFLREDNSSSVSYFVISGKGEDLAPDTKVLDISKLFMEKLPEYKITDVTGWGGMTLIVVNTDKKDGGMGPSFWFDVTNSSFIRLSSRFN